MLMFRCLSQLQIQPAPVDQRLTLPEPGRLFALPPIDDARGRLAARRFCHEAILDDLTAEHVKLCYT